MTKREIKLVMEKLMKELYEKERKGLNKYTDYYLGQRSGVRELAYLLKIDIE